MKENKAKSPGAGYLDQEKASRGREAEQAGKQTRKKNSVANLRRSETQQKKRVVGGKKRLRNGLQILSEETGRVDYHTTTSAYARDAEDESDAEG